MIEELIRGGDGEWLTDATCNRVHAGSIPTPASNFATEAEALTSAPAFNHTQPKLYGPKQPELYRSGCVSQIGAQSWMNNRNVSNVAS
jgi:hypothetical protein